MSFPAALPPTAGPATAPQYPGLMELPPEMPMPMPMAQPSAPQVPMDPSSQIIDAEFEVLVSEAESSIAPKPPPWFVALPKPTKEQICSEAHEQRELHSRRILRQAYMQLRLGMELTAIFHSDKLWVEIKEIEPQPSPILRIIHDAIVNFVATQTVQHSSLAHGLVNREERSGIEDHLDDSHRDWRDSHFREGGGSLLRTLTTDALSGMVAVYHAPDPSNERSGQRRYRVDPKVVFPVFGRDGLDAVYVVYDANYHEVMRDYGDGVNPQTDKPNPVTKKIQDIAAMGRKGDTTRVDTETSYELIAYYDRKRGAVLWRGEILKEWDHNLWVCPWHIGVPNWRQQGGSKNQGGFTVGGNRPGPLIEANGVSTPYDMGVSTGGNREADLVRLYEPFLTPWIAVVDKFEKVQTRLTYGVDRALDNPLVWKRAASNSEVGTPEIQNFRRGVTEIEEDEEVDTLPVNPMSDVFMPWLELFKVELQAAIPVPILQGQSIGTQASGNAIDVLTELGYAHFAPVPEFIQQLLGEIDHRDLIYIRDWNKTYRQGGKTGVAVPSRYQNGYGADPIRLTAEMLERAGCYVECTLRRFSLSGAAAHATAAAIMDQQMHLGTRRFWGQTFGLPNAHRLEDDRMIQDMEDTPGFVEAKAIVYLKQQMDRASAMQDDDSLLTIMTTAKRVASKQSLHDMQIAKMLGMLAPQPTPMEGDLPGSETRNGNPLPYMSAPENARETGTEGGAPAAAAGPLPVPGTTPGG
jgi:hypothetical protein